MFFLARNAGFACRRFGGLGKFHGGSATVMLVCTGRQNGGSAGVSKEATTTGKNRHTRENEKRKERRGEVR